ncbi:MAG: NAD(P)-dependent alcohol dehydrogenase [Suipraeoptans sp.]
MKNRAYYLLAAGQLEERECEMPVCRDEDVMIQIEYCGVCGSDVYFYKYGSPDYTQQRFPFILGHEPGGTVIEVGNKVTNLKVGDRVAVEPGYSCGHCEWCRNGQYHLCPEVRFLSIPAPNFVDGAFRKYMAHPSERCFKLPDDVTTMQGALIEPLTVGMSGVRNSGIRTGDTAVVMGAGCIGLSALQTLRASGITDITVVDLQEIRLNKAKELGASTIINASRVDTIKEIEQLTGSRGADYVFETAGSKVTAAQTVYLAKRGGVIVMIGNTGKFEFDFQRLIDREIYIKSSFRYNNIYPVALDLVAAGKIQPESVVTDVFTFEEIPEAMKACVERQDEVVKAVIKIGD